MEKLNDDSTTNQTPPNDTHSNEPITPPEAKVEELENHKEDDRKGIENNPFYSIVSSYKLGTELGIMKEAENDGAELEELINEYYKEDSSSNTQNQANGLITEESVLEGLIELDVYKQIQDDYDKLNEKHKKRHTSIDISKGDALNIT